MDATFHVDDVINGILAGMGYRPILHPDAHCPRETERMNEFYHVKHWTARPDHIAAIRESLRLTRLFGHSKFATTSRTLSVARDYDLFVQLAIHAAEMTERAVPMHGDYLGGYVLEAFAYAGTTAIVTTQFEDGEPMPLLVNLVSHRLPEVVPTVKAYLGFVGPTPHLSGLLGLALMNFENYLDEETPDLNVRVH